MQLPRIHFVTFCTRQFERAAQRLITSAVHLRFFSSIRAVRFEDIAEHEFVKDRDWIDPTVRGCGFWAWKPYVIRQALDCVPAGDVVLYWDAGQGPGNRFFLPPKKVVTHALRSSDLCPGVEIPQWGPNRYWTHLACFDALGVSQDAAFTAPQIQTTFSIWRNHPTSIAFLEEWLDFCGDIVVVGDTDAKQPDGFVDHRHDQSVCTLLSRKYSIEGIHLANPAIVHFVHKNKRFKNIFKDINFVELALMERSGLLAFAYRSPAAARKIATISNVPPPPGI